MAVAGKERIQISLTHEQMAELKEVSRALGITKSTAISFALGDWLKKVKEDRGMARS